MLDLHPLCTLFPRMSGYEFECLKLDIKENGLRTPITTYRGMILDGGNRYKACVDLNINPLYEEFSGSAIGAFVLTSNLHRRHLTPAQSAAIVASVQDWSKSQSVGKPKCATNSTLDTAKSRSAQSGASLATQRKADAVAKANPELAAKVGRGEISLNAATREVAPQLAPKQTQPEEEYSEIDALSDQVSELQNIVAAGFAGTTDEDRASGLKLIADLRQEIKTLNATLAAVTISRDTFQRENAEMKKQLARQRNEIEKLKGKKC